MAHCAAYNGRTASPLWTEPVASPGTVHDEPEEKKVLGTRGYDTSFDAPAAGTLTLTWTTRVHGRLVTVARGSNVAGQVGRRPVPIKLTALPRSETITTTFVTQSYCAAPGPRPPRKRYGSSARSDAIG